MGKESNILFYTTPSGQVSVQVQYEDGSLQKEAAIRKIRIVQQEGKKEVSRE
jgi:hypothetical protein